MPKSVFHKLFDSNHTMYMIQVKQLNTLIQVFQLMWFKQHLMKKYQLVRIKMTQYHGPTLKLILKKGNKGITLHSWNTQNINKKRPHYKHAKNQITHTHKFTKASKLKNDTIRYLDCNFNSYLRFWGSSFSSTFGWSCFYVGVDIRAKHSLWSVGFSSNVLCYIPLCYPQFFQYEMHLTHFLEVVEFVKN